MVSISTFIARERQRDDTNVLAFERESARTRGLSGPPIPMPRIRTDEEREAAAAQLLADFKAWEYSPRGRLLSTLTALAVVGYAHTAERVRAAYSRGMADDRQPVNPDEVGFAMTELLSIPPLDSAAAGHVRVALGAVAQLLRGGLEEAA